MSRPHVYRTEAIVLGHYRWGEADRIVIAITPLLGKLRFVAKGVRRIHSRLAGHLELLTRCDLSLARGHSLDIATQAQTLESFAPLRSDLERLSCALYAAELVERFSADAAESAAVYRLLLETLRWLADGDSPPLALRYFDVHLLRHLGYMPELRRCLDCNAAVDDGDAFFTANGGVLCHACAVAEPTAHPISAAALAALRALAGSGPTRARQLALTPAVAVEIEYLLRHYIQYLLEGAIRSVAFLEAVSQQSAAPLAAPAGVGA